MIIKIEATCLTISKDISKVNKDKAIYEGQRCNLFIDGKYFPSNIINIVGSDFLEFDSISEITIEVVVNDFEKNFFINGKFELREANKLLAMCTVL